jgi:hypothetical protein
MPNPKDWKDRLTETLPLVMQLAAGSEFDYADYLWADMKAQLDGMSETSRKQLSESMHLGTKKDENWRKWVRCIILIEQLIVRPGARRMAAAIISACVPKSVDQVKADGKALVRSLDPWTDYGFADTQVVRPLKIGCSVSGGDATGPGTIACFVKDNKTGDIMFLTNQHVALQEFGTATTVDPEMRQPAKLNGGSTANKIGKYVRGILDSRMDAAVCKLNHGIAWANETRRGRSSAGIPITGVNRNFQKDEVVWKCGSMSYIAWARIKDANKLTATVPHSNVFGGNVIFKNQIEVESLLQGREFQVRGDSGSALINQSNEIVGLMHGGLKGGGLATPIGDVFDALDVSFA